MVWMQALVVATVFSASGDSVLLDFYSDSCAPCRAMGPTIDALVDQGLPVRKVNISREPQLARQFGVTQVPCYVMVADGQEVDRVLGTTTFSRLQRMFDLIPARPTPGSPAFAAPNSPGARPSTTAIPPSDSPLPLGASLQQATAGAWTSQPKPMPAPLGTGSLNPASIDSALVAATVRLRIEDPTGSSCGSGTIIDARRGEALILTCGHVFRDSQGRGDIEVDLFGPDGVVQVAGRLISYDLERDLGLVSIRTPGPVTAVSVAPPGHHVAPGDAVVSVGCNNGAEPTVQHSRIVSLDKFAGPPNLQVQGMPVEGRSGGGLFSADGMLIGVCNAADPADREGLFAAIGSIHAELDRGQLTFVYNSGTSAPSASPAADVSAAALVSDVLPRMPEQMPDSRDPFTKDSPNRLSPVGAAGPRLARMSVEERAALDEIQRRLDDGAEVVCIIRSRRDPEARSEVIILNHTESNIAGQLAGAGGFQEEAEVVCVARSPHDPHARSEIFVLNQVSGGFLGQLTSLGQASPEPVFSTSLEIPRTRPSAVAASTAGGWEVSAPDQVVRR